MRSTRLHIIISSARPWNIPRISQAYLSRMEPHQFELRFHVLCQGPDRDPKGTNKVNEAIDSVRDGWMFMFADDTIQHAALFRRLGEVISDSPNSGCVVFAEDRGETVLHPSPENVCIGKICGGMVAIERTFLADLRFDYAAHKHECDGFLLTELHRKDPSKFVYVDETLCRFNSLER